MDDLIETTRPVPGNTQQSVKLNTAEVHVGELPIWMQESSSSYKLGFLPLPVRKALRIPGRSWRFLKKWSKGPNPARIQQIKPFFPSIQDLPLRLVERFLPRKSHKVIAILLYWLSYALIFSGLVWQSANSGHIEGYGMASPLSCSDSLWHNNNGCGINGNDCHPFDNSTIAFRCAASCKDTLLQEPYPIGGMETTYTPLVIGSVNATGTPIYRADSLVCQAAIHAGAISNTRGGCGVIALAGTRDNFLPSYSNGIQSFGFDASFPKAFTFLRDVSSDCDSADVRWKLLAVSATYTAVFSLFVSSPAVFFYPILIVLFLHISLISDPPDVPDYSTRVSLFISRLVPVCFIAAIYYKFTIHRTLRGLTCQVEKSVLWLSGAWIGSLNNYTFKDIPIQRLTPHDLKQAGAIPALLTIILILLLIAGGQAYYLWLEGRFRRYLALYGAFVSFLLIGVALPSHNVRIHHYLLAMLLLPGTSIQTRPSLFYQGLLIGLFLNGIARWGFAPILETPEMLFGGLPEFRPQPNITSILAPNTSSLDFTWSWPPIGYTGVSMLVNDVERYRWYVDNENTTLSWHSEDLRTEKEYIRFAYIHNSNPAMDYTKAGVWDTDHSWSGIPGEYGATSFPATTDCISKHRTMLSVGY